MVRRCDISDPCSISDLFPSTSSCSLYPSSISQASLVHSYPIILPAALIIHPRFHETVAMDFKAALVNNLKSFVPANPPPGSDEPKSTPPDASEGNTSGRSLNPAWMKAAKQPVRYILLSFAYHSFILFTIGRTFGSPSTSPP